MPSVQIVTGENRKKAVKIAVDGLGHDFMRRAQRAQYILLKPDLVHHSLQLASTHVDAVRGIIEAVRMYSDAPIVVADGAQFGTKTAFKNLEFEALIHEYRGISLFDLNEDEVIETVLQRSDSSTLIARRSKTAIEAPFSISLAPMKTHARLGVALSASNWAEGTWIVPPRSSSDGRIWTRAPWRDTLGVKDAHLTVADLFSAYPCQVGVVDGILAMEGNGPINGTPVHAGVVLAGFDPVAVDTVAATLMGFDAHDIGYLERCAAKGIGVNEITDIDVPLLDLQRLTRQFSSNTNL